MLKIGVLDSGIGGLTTCCAIFRRLGAVEIEYFSDNGNAPYGTSKKRRVKRAVKYGVEYLISLGAEAVVLACNTATVLTVSSLRRRFKDTPIIGIEPALKPALSVGGKTLLIATPQTLKAKKIMRLIEENPSVNTADTASLASRIEEDIQDEKRFEGLATDICKLAEKVDNLVLGCTHYCLLKSRVSELLPRLNLFDGNDGVAERLASVLSHTDEKCRKTPLINVYFSGNSEIEKYKAVLSLSEKEQNFSVQNFKLTV